MYVASDPRGGNDTILRAVATLTSHERDMCPEDTSLYWEEAKATMMRFCDAVRSGGPLLSVKTCVKDHYVQEEGKFRPHFYCFPVRSPA